MKMPKRILIPVSIICSSFILLPGCGLLDIGEPRVMPSLSNVVTKVEPSVVTVQFAVLGESGKTVYESAGSGWIYDENGIIVTNYHVVENTSNVVVTLSDGRVFIAESVKSDPYTDLAIIKINATGLPEAKIGDSSRVKVGDWVIAIGNPLGVGVSVKQGIVSRLGVVLSLSDGNTLYDLIETDTNINTGDSGGPLANMAGEVIGITSAKIATPGLVGISYSINMDDAKPIIQGLIVDGCIIRPWLGVVLRTVDRQIAYIYGLKTNTGVMVSEVTPGSPADKAGLKAKDVITLFGEYPVDNAADLMRIINSSKVGQTVRINFMRDEIKNTVNATLEESPPHHEE